VSRPELAQVLAPLKGFQRRTVDHAFHRLFTAPDSTARFLVADEVGLGKTLVARGIIAKAIDHLWHDVDRIDIVYICSNASIARQNLDKLRVSGGGEQSMALASRLTLLGTQLAREDGRGLADNKLNFISFTPGTSFEMGHATGAWTERRVLFELLFPHVQRWLPLANLLQGNVTRRDRWLAALEHDPSPIEPGIRTRFNEAWRADLDLQREVAALLEAWFFRHRQRWPDEARWRRNRVISQLRHHLARVSVHALEPDLVILDEFQRFKKLLETRADQRDPAAELAQALFSAQTPEGQPVRTLLLSATPYKLYTADAEIEHEDHYADFLATTRFLLDDEARVGRLQSSLAGFGRALTRAAAGGPDEVQPARRQVEDQLRAVMSRTERVASTQDHDAMVQEPIVDTQVQTRDVRQYLATNALFRTIGAQDPMRFWKAAPYLPHFMHGYRANDRLDQALLERPDQLAQVLTRHRAALLDRTELEAFAPLAPDHAKLRALLDQLDAQGLWRLLWLPPTVPYWPLAGPFEGTEGATKTLLFSAWNVVPDVVSAALSYETERRMCGGRLASYLEPAKQQGRLLALAQTAEGRRTNHRRLLLLLPVLTLAEGAHPLSAPVGSDRQVFVRERVRDLLAACPDPRDGEVDERWEWALPLVLDPGLRTFLVHWQGDPDLPQPNAEVLGAYLQDWIDLDPATLGRRPEGLEDLAVALALGSPAVAACSAVAPSGMSELDRRGCALWIAHACWALFNRPDVITLLRGLPGDRPYWRAVLDYCRDGNLQAVLDESWHLAWEQRAWDPEATTQDKGWSCADELADAIQPVRSRVHARLFELDGDRVATTELRLRTDLALRFGKATAEDRQHSQDAVRGAFNSPFRPFVLASTSVGQEGLDFHPWCHRLVHWSLPGNPVDLEQREGRVHRYKGHAVRRNVAELHAQLALDQWRPGQDLWTAMFELASQAARARGDSDLVPWWVAPGSVRVERHVPLLPYTREVEAFQRLKRQLAAYRVVFGQPRQEELLTLLGRSGLDTRKLQEWVIDLGPPE